MDEVAGKSSGRLWSHSDKERTNQEECCRDDRRSDCKGSCIKFHDDPPFGHYLPGLFGPELGRRLAYSRRSECTPRQILPAPRAPSRRASLTYIHTSTGNMTSVSTVGH